MGYGDELMASGMARGAAARGKRIAFGDGHKIRWHRYAEEIFRGNPNVAPPGSEGARDLEWIAHYHGKRLYVEQVDDRWIWTSGHCKTGEVFFSDGELEFAEKQGSGFVVVEPNVPAFKHHGVNKQWPTDRYELLARQLTRDGYDVVQFIVGPPHGSKYLLSTSRKIEAPSFRHALAVMSRASLYIGPEGGLHHGAAAVGTRGVVIFGAFISPAVTGYSQHQNLVSEGAQPCGSLKPCLHCADAMASIPVGQVLRAAQEELRCG